MVKNEEDKRMSDITISQVQRKNFFVHPAARGVQTILFEVYNKDKKILYPTFYVEL